ncbi:hypothetical protein TOPH_09040 [Tolypocladium ophioglossoides CBS 100239]|uniref:SGNH hydrolase-type esterase domain-containing protein n=1 Tax=Tolypocladium ophioglossoides (strain CBS 100239) TaxID=1163406 RepID=A0A0L0MWN3_TOLOC|nr:hypothetical protein TOPH_09040 [Tolypocladium ophioglossoides CBS 100239]
MASFFQSLSRVAVVGLALLSNVQASPASWLDSHHGSLAGAKASLRLMPLGASITYGYLSSDGNGYRNDLRQILVSDGYTVDMVGSRKAGSMKNNDNEGWPGLRIEQVEAKAKLSVPGLTPNLFTINAGTNDCVQDFDIDNAGKRMGDLLEYVWGASPGSTVILSTLLLNRKESTEARVLRVNKQFRDLAKQKAAERKRIVLVDMHGPDGPQKGDMADDTHPNDVGYNKMAKIWHRGIQEAASKSFLNAPVPIA